MFKNKYLKYKKKYLDLSASVGTSFLCSPQKGGAAFSFDRSHKVLVIGGGSGFTDYCQNQPPDICGFYEIGDHERSYYGIGKNWETSEFWIGLEQKLSEDNLVFDAIIIDHGSESWIPIDNRDIMKIIISTLINRLNPKGILIIEVNFDSLEYNRSRLNTLFWLGGLNVVGITSFEEHGLLYNIQSRVDKLDNILLENKQGLYSPNTIIREKKWIRYKSGIRQSDFASVVDGIILPEEKTIVEFCKNRIINN